MKERIANFWRQRTQREKVVASLALLLFFITVVYPTFVSPVVSAFASQSERLGDLKRIYATTPEVLEKYAGMVARRKDIDSFYGQADLSADPLSYLEGLLRDTAQAAGTYNVTPREGVQLGGGKYVHKFFAVNFQTASYENLAAFLKALTTGKQPMLVSQINLEKRSGADALTVQLEVSGFEPLSKR
jgi:type II secretory pathway component PulM